MKEGKRLLKEGSGSAALVRFEKAAMLSRATGNKSMQRRAFRGLAAAERLQGQKLAAIRHLMVVLQISKGACAPTHPPPPSFPFWGFRFSLQGLVSQAKPG